jgi:hypothetical protein
MALPALLIYWSVVGDDGHPVNVNSIGVDHPGFHNRQLLMLTRLKLRSPFCQLARL